MSFYLSDISLPLGIVSETKWKKTYYNIWKPEMNFMFWFLLLFGEIVATTGAKNCLLARQLCAEDSACRSILEIIPRVCGSESVACATATVNKCLAALRTIQGFPYFQPTCLCREPHLDHECNVFREFIFDHPCMFVQKTDGSPYEVHALPLCDYAYRVCRSQLPGCIQLFENFKQYCLVVDGRCRMDQPKACINAWNKLKTAPMFGCICHNDHQKKCSSIFDIIHKNPCVDLLPVSSAHSHFGDLGRGVWSFPLPTPSPTLHTPQIPPPYFYPLYPYIPKYLPSNTHVSLYTYAPLHPAYAAQTHNILTVEQQPQVRNSPPGSFAVSAIPNDKSLTNIMTQGKNPLIEADGVHVNGSRAIDVLKGGEGKRYPDVRGHSSQTSTYKSLSPIVHSTCQTAYQGCFKDPACRRLLNPVLSSCQIETCDRESCMSDLQTFYRNVETRWAQDVAFCLCKKSSLTANECLAMQEKLHPECARRPARPAPVLCNQLAMACKEDPSCRHRLEFYEQACAVDSDTRKCAGPTTECRRAVLGILGTTLRNKCTCASKDITETYTCLDWQKILWFNPCVVEAQTDYHREMLESLGQGEEMTIPPSMVSKDVTTAIVVMQKPVQKLPSTTEPTTVMATTVTTTTKPSKFCKKVHRRTNVLDYIPEGKAKRYYDVTDSSSCSELCVCHHKDKLVCNVISCVEPKSCETGYAVYTHSAPAYQANRGACICYSGSFICQRPPKGEYDLEDGVFLFLGYSRLEEQLMKPYTGYSVEDLLPFLTELLRMTETRTNKTELCSLSMVYHREENIVIQATLEKYDEIRENMTAEALNDEKENCESPLELVSSLINNRDKEVHNDVALSMIILAQTQAKVPPLRAATGLPRLQAVLVVWTLLSVRTFNTLFIS